MLLALAQGQNLEYEGTEVPAIPKLSGDDVFYPLGLLIEYAEAGMDISNLRVIPQEEMAPSAGRERGLQRQELEKCDGLRFFVLNSWN